MGKSKNNIFHFWEDIFVKTYQIIFGMMVVGALIQTNINILIFFIGIIGSLTSLMTAVIMFDKGLKEEQIHG